MSYHMYHVCRRHVGRSVLVTTTEGKKYHGVIKHVDDEKVYLLPHADGLGDDERFIAPVLVGLGLGTIVGLALAPRPIPIYPPYPPYPYPYQYPYPY